MAQCAAVLAATLLAMLGALAAHPASAAATSPCPVQYCTDPSGEYVLEVPPLTQVPGLGSFSVCTWDVLVDFGDGTSEEYEFDGAVGLTGSHVFPTPGTTYTVVIYLGNGRSSIPERYCPEVPISSEIRYRTPEEEADPPPPDPGGGEGEEEGPPPVEPPPPGAVDEGAAKPGAGPSALVAPPAAAAPRESPAVERSAYWRRCPKGVLTHLVGCRRGRGVARVAVAKLTRPGSRRVAGFRCRRVRVAVQPIVCRRGRKAVLAPTA